MGESTLLVWTIPLLTHFKETGPSILGKKIARIERRRSLLARVATHETSLCRRVGTIVLLSLRWFLLTE